MLTSIFVGGYKGLKAPVESYLVSVFKPLRLHYIDIQISMCCMCVCFVFVCIYYGDFVANITEWKKQGNSSVWLHVPIELSHLICKAASLGFTFHHAKQCHSVLNLWLDSSRPSRIPLYGTHQVGVAGETF